MPAALAHSLGLPAGAPVTVVPLPDDLPPAASVTLEPASADDWEVVELNSDFIEEQLLNQGGVASGAQLLPVWVRSGQAVLLRVTAAEPPAPAVRLVRGTEVLVAPRVRVREQQGAGRGDSASMRPDSAGDASKAAPLRTALRLQLLPGGALPAGAGRKPLPAGMRIVGVAAATLQRCGLADGDWVSLIAPSGALQFACLAASEAAAPGHLAAPHAACAALGAEQYDAVTVLKLTQAQRDDLLEDALERSALRANGGSAFAAAAPPAPEPAAAAAAAQPSRPAPPPACFREALLATLAHVLPVLAARPRSVLQAWGAPRPGGVLVAGAPGSGKTALVRGLVAALGSHPQCLPTVQVVSCRELGAEGGAAARAALAPRFAAALARPPALVVLDDLDVLCPAAGDDPEASLHGPGDGSLAAWLCDVMDSLTAAAPEWRAGGGAPGGAWPPVAVVATCRDAAAVAAPLRRCGRLEAVVELAPPTADSRAAMLAAGVAARLAGAEAGDLRAAAARAEGYDGGDINVLLDRAMRLAAVQQLAAGGGGAGPGGGVVLGAAALEGAAEGLTPAAFWGAGTATSVTAGVEGWQDVGGLAAVRAALQEALELPVKHAALVARAPLRLRTGALLFGPPGCGKTHAVAAAVAAAGLRCISVSGPELLNKYIGASEAAVRDVFRRAAAAAPSVLFFDEFDAIAPQRGHDNTGVTDRVVNQLLTELDGVEGLRGVCVVAATSRPDLVDAALLRPGRLDRLLHCGFPSPAERREVAAALARRLRLAPDADVEGVAGEAQGFSGADLGALLSEAQLAAAHEALEAREAAGGGGGRGGGAQGVEVAGRHLRAALRSVRPSVSAAERERLAAVYEPFLSGGGGGGGQRRATAAEKGKGKMVSWA
jgi:SpoVK/Ycf46/Vps4 family AAA+-type ATPase